MLRRLAPVSKTPYATRSQHAKEKTCLDVEEYETKDARFYDEITYL